MSEFKKIISNILLAGAAAALVAFGYSLFIPKVWQVTGKVVVVPSGSSPTAGANLFVEAANTAEMVTSPSFQKNILGKNAKFFSGAEQFKNSSTVEINFAGRESDLEMIENMIVKLPENISSYAREIYGGSPFKYLIVSDPEISAQPVRPNVLENVVWGFGVGFALYFLYWLFVESFVAGRRAVEKGKGVLPVASVIPFESEPAEPISYEPIPEPMPEIFPEAEAAAPPEKRIITPISSAPENLPVAEAEPEIPSAPEFSEYQEPSDEEVKERLNRLMRGEL